MTTHRAELRGSLRVMAFAMVLVNVAALSDGADTSASAHPRLADRPGFIWAFSFGGGAMLYDREPGLAVLDPGPPERTIPVPERHGSGGFAMFVGWAFNERFAAGLDVDLEGGLRDDQFQNIVGGLAAQYWPTPRAWVRAGVGSGELTLPYADGTYTTGSGPKEALTRGGPALFAAVGVELLQKPRWTLDLSARFATVGYDLLRVTQLSIQFGGAWYPQAGTGR
jgi:hypothetical protein